MNATVAVVGAGAAGLSAAYTLKRRGVRVTVYEALDRVGGRIHAATDFAPYPVELGAESINGFGHRVHRWAWHNSLTLVRPPSGMREYFAVNGAVVDEHVFHSSPAARELEELWGSMLSYRGADLSVAEFVAREGISAQAVAALRHQAAEIARDLEHLSVLGMREMAAATEATEDQTARLRVPYLTAFTHVVQALEGRIRTETPVRRVAIQESGVELETGAGERERFDRAVITVPLGVLKREAIEFAPRLPQRKLVAVERLDFTPGLKVALRFARRFWPDDMDYLGGLPCGIIWPPQGARDGGEPVLINYAVGIHAEHLRSSDGPAPAQRVVQELDGVFDGQASRELVDSRVMDWTDVPSIGGYFTSPTSEWYLEDKAALAEPVENRLYFAGEATNTHLASMGYVHGAVKTGHRAAKAVLRSL